MKRFRRVSLVMAIFLFFSSNISVVHAKDDEINWYKHNTGTDNSIYETGGNAVKPVVKLDGLLDEAQWKKAGATTYGKNNMANVKSFSDENGYYFGFTVKDTDVRGSMKDPTESDCVELYFDTLDDNNLKPQKDDYQINIGVGGNVRLLVGNGKFWTQWNASIFYETKVNGTMNDKVKDQGYTVEIFVPFNEIGIKPTKSIGMTLGVADKNDGKERVWSGVGGKEDPQVPQTYGKISISGIYSRYRVEHLKSSVKAQISVDGVTNEKKWDQAASFTIGTDGKAKVSYFGDSKGLYVAFNVQDSTLNARTADTFRNDSMELYIDSKGNGGKNPQLDDIQINCDLAGNLRMLKGNGKGWQEAPLAFNYATKVNGKVNSSIGEDKGYIGEFFISWKDLKISAPKSIKMAFGVMDVDNKGKTKWHGFAGCDPQKPSQYLKLPLVQAEVDAKIDGVLDDEIWKNNDKLFMFPYNSTLRIMSYRGKQGINLAIYGNDPYIWTDKSNVWKNDSIEIYLDPQNNRGTTLQNDDIQIRLDAGGRVEFLKYSTASKKWVPWLTSVKTAAKVYGTANINTGLQDNKFTMEIFIPYHELGVTQSSPMGINFGRVDRWSASEKDREWLGYNGTDVQKPSTYFKFNQNGIEKAVSKKMVETKWKLDGVLDEAKWKNSKTIRYQDTTFKYFWGYDGLYTSFEVKDSHLVNNNKKPWDWNCDGIEFYLDVKGDGGDIPKTDDLQLRIDATGKSVMLYRGTNKKNGWTDAMDNQIVARTYYKGTINKNTDTDQGYAVEIFIPFSDLGVTKAVPVKIAAGTLDVNTPNTGKTDRWYGMSGIDPQVPDSYQLLPEGETSTTSIYPKPEFKIDGNIEKGVWLTKSKAYPLGFGAKAKILSYCGKDGVYFAARVRDTKIWTNSDIVNNDRVEIYLDTKNNGGETPEEKKNDDFQFRVDADGKLQALRWNEAGKTWVELGTIAQKKKEYNNVLGLFGKFFASVGSVIGLNPTSSTGTENDSGIQASVVRRGTENDNSDADLGYDMEIYIPYFYLGSDIHQDSVMGVNFGLGERWDKDAGIWLGNDTYGFKDPQIPASYMTMNKTGITGETEFEFVKPEVQLDGTFKDSTFWDKAAKLRYGSDTPVTMYKYKGEKGYYFAFDVKDEKKVEAGDNPWEWTNDGIEMYLDAGNKGGARPMTDDYQIRIDHTGRKVNILRGDGAKWVPDVTPNIDIVASSSETGYVAQIFVPFGQLSTKADIEPNTAAGVLSFSEKGSTPRWEGIDGVDPQIPGNYVQLNATAGYAPAPRKATTPTINYLASEYTINGNLNKAPWNTKTEAYAFGFGSKAKVMSHFGDNGVYLAVEVKDGNIWTNVPEIYKNDSVEIYLDTLNDGGAASNERKTDDYQFRIDATGNVEAMRYNPGNGDWAGISSHGLGLSAQISGTPNDGLPDNKYVIEVYIPYKYLGNTLSKTSEMAINFGLLDKWDTNNYTWLGNTVGGFKDPQIPDSYLTMSLAGGIAQSVPYQVIASDVVLDGETTDAQWATADSFTYNSATPTLVKRFKGTNGFYFAFTVTDTELFNNRATMPWDWPSDGIELYMDMDNDGGVNPQANDYQIRVDFSGRHINVMKGTNAPAGWAEELTANIYTGIKYTGSINTAAGASGYTIEMFIPYGQMGLTAASNPGVAIGTLSQNSGGGFHSWQGVPAIDPQIPNQYFDFTYLPSEIAIDGELNKAVWTSKTKAYAFGFGSRVNVLSNMTANGLYLAARIKDTRVWTSGADPDRLEIYIDSLNDGGGKNTNDYQFRLDAAGRLVAMRWDGVNWAEISSVGIRTAAQIAGNPNDNSDSDNYYDVEMYIPYTYLGNGITEVSTMGINFGLWERWDVGGATWLSNDTGGFKDPQDPAVYMDIAVGGIGGEVNYSLSEPELALDGSLTDVQWSTANSAHYGAVAGAATETQTANDIKWFKGTNGFYFAINVEDIDLYEHNGNMPWDWNNDGVEFYIDTLNDRGASPNNNDYQIRVDLTGRKTNLLVRNGVNWDDVKTADIYVGVSKNSGGYTMEIFLPYGQLGLTNLSTPPFAVGTVSRNSAGDFKSWDANKDVANPNDYQGF